MIDREIGQYWVLEPVATGARGTLYKGVHKTADQEVEIRELTPACFADQAAKARFVQSATFLRRANPRVISRILLVAEAEESVHLVTEHLPLTLEERLRMDGPMTQVAALDLARRILDVLHYLHRYRVVHGHISPKTVCFTADQSAKLGFFGASGFGDDYDDLYQPPEAADGAPASVAADIYAVGVTLRRMLGAEPPFAAADYPLHVAPPTEASADPLSPALQEVLAKATARDATARHKSARDFADALEKAARSGKQWRQRVVYAMRAGGPLVLMGLFFAALLLPLLLPVGRHQEKESARVALQRDASPPPSPALPAPPAPPASIPAAAAPTAPRERPQASRSKGPRTAPRHAHAKKHHVLAQHKRQKREPAAAEQDTASLSPSPGAPHQTEGVESWSIRK